MSTASIKSGVIGYPQGSSDAHAARPIDNPFEQSHRGIGQSVPEEGPAGARTGDQQSHVGRDAALGAGAAGAGALAAHGLGNQHENDTPRVNLQRQESDVPESGRSFPLSGGVAQQGPTTSSTAEREPGTKEREAGVHENYGREGLAGAAAAAAAATAGKSSISPQNNGRTEGNIHTQTPGSGAYTQTSGSNTHTQTSGSTNPEALAAATAATSAAGVLSHEHNGHGHRFEGERLRSPDEPKTGLLFTDGPHVTDTANRLDPHLHIPGEYPSPTPVEESNASSYLQSKPTTSTNPSAFAQPELRHTGTLDQSQRHSNDSSSEHHYGRDAAIAGGVGAVGAGAYAAGKHHGNDTANIDQATLPSTSNAPSSEELDPTVSSDPRAGLADQRFDPTASENRSPRNAALTGGAIGGAHGVSHPSGQEAPKGREIDNKEYPAASNAVKSDDQHHYGRDAALVGAGAATTAGLYASQRQKEPDSGPASSTIGPHKSNIANVLDPRVQPNPDLQKHHHAAPTVEDPAPSTVGPHKSDLANVLDPKVLPDPQKQKAAPKEAAGSSVPEKDPRREHHLGRDAAVVGGAGAAGYGAHEAAQAYGNHPSTQPSASMNEQRYDPSAPGAHDPRAVGTQPHNVVHQDQQHHYGRDAAVVGGLGAAGAGAYAATRGHEQPQPSSVNQVQNAPAPRVDEPRAAGAQPSSAVPQPQEHHYGRDAAVVGGLGAAGAGTYAAARQHDHAQQLNATQTYQQPLATQPGEPVSASHQRYDSTQAPEQDHTKRNAALGTAAGAGALGAGAYGLSEHDAKKEQERRLKEQQKTFDDQQKALEKKQAHDQKHHDKLVAAEEKKHHKEAEAKEKEHAKELEKQQYEHDKQLAAARAEQQRRSKEEARPEEEEGTPEKKHRFLTFLNKKDKDKTGSPEASPRASRDSPRHSKEYAAGAAGAAAYEHEHEDGRHLGEKKGRNVLHKDPPPGHPAREADLARHAEAGKREHIGTDGPIGDPNLVSGDQ